LASSRNFKQVIGNDTQAFAMIWSEVTTNTYSKLQSTIIMVFFSFPSYFISTLLLYHLSYRSACVTWSGKKEFEAFQLHCFVFIIVIGTDYSTMVLFYCV